MQTIEPSLNRHSFTSALYRRTLKSFIPKAVADEPAARRQAVHEHSAILPAILTIPQLLGFVAAFKVVPPLQPTSFCNCGRHLEQLEASS